MRISDWSSDVCSSDLPSACPGCDAEGTMAACGPGVERLAEEARVLFPQARQAMMTSDTLTGPESAAALVRAVQARSIDILIGTQIVAKGHHFPHMPLVGVSSEERRVWKECFSMC